MPGLLGVIGAAALNHKPRNYTDVAWQSACSSRRRSRPWVECASTRFDVAVVAATNANLEEAVMRGTFRQDLLVRVSRECASLSPLRKRAEEIPTVATFVAGAITHKKLSAMLIEECVFRAWRGGNHRALVQTIERAARLAKAEGSSPEIVKQQLPDPSPWDGWDVVPAPPLAPRILSQREVKEEAFVRAYMKSGNVDQAALEADISRTTGYEIVKRRNLKT